MQKILDGKLYDTETADCLAQWDNGKFLNDFNHDYSNLYITKKGQFFVAGNTLICKDEEYCGVGEMTMRLISKDEVLDWMEYREITPAEVDNFSDHFAIEQG